MPATYSINVGTITESTRKENVFSVVQELPDNTQKLISPRDVRDAFLSAWANSAFKITTPGLLTGSEYIGLDSGNPSDRDIKKKIFIGKRSYGNLDIIDNALLGNLGSDIYFFNTKDDSATQSSTKISILAGTNSSLYTNAPYIEAVLGTSSLGINLELRNPSLFEGPINIVSQQGRVAINGIVFPTLAETAASASNGRILRYYGTYPNGYLRWDDTNITIANIGTPTTVTNIYGSPSNVNGYSLEFVEDAMVPQTIGGIEIGSSFSAFTYDATAVTGNFQNWPMVEVIRKLLYPYVPPVLTLSVVNPFTGTTFAEVGTTPSIVVNYSLTSYARDENEYIADFVISGTTYSAPIGGFSFSASPGNGFSGTASGVTSSFSSGTTNYVFAASDKWGPFSAFTASSYPAGFSHSATASIQFVDPFLLTFGDFGITFNSTMIQDIHTSATTSRTIFPYIGPSQSVTMPAEGYGYLYFAYPYSYPELSLIKDVNGFIIHDSTSLTYSAFTFSTSGLSSFYTTYRIYRTVATCSYVGIGKFEFIF
jgi:hypothetical protein